MKKSSVFFAVAILLSTLFAGTAFKPLPPGPSANGQGTLFTGEPTRHFSFHANTMPGGSVQGSGVLHRIGGVLDVKFDIDCMRIDGNMATLSGIITYHSNPVFVGRACYFQVKDNGEGSNSSGDQMTLMFVDLDPGFPYCQLNSNLVLNTIEGGNIQVKP